MTKESEGWDDATAEDTIRQRLARGDGPTFWHVWERHRRKLQRTCERMLDRHPDYIDDALSRAMLCAKERLAHHAPHIRNLEHWLNALTRNQCLDILREIKRDESRRGGDESTLESIEGGLARGSFDCPESALQRETLSHRISVAIEDLPDRLKHAFVLRHVHECDYQEIASRLDITAVNARKRVQQACERLRPRLSGEYRT
jgi:RNA polymerase sigma-70 factor (ECF subfamily)